MNSLKAWKTLFFVFSKAQFKGLTVFNHDDILRTPGGDIKQHNEWRMGRISGVFVLRRFKATHNANMATHFRNSDTYLR